MFIFRKLRIDYILGFLVLELSNQQNRIVIEEAMEYLAHLFVLINFMLKLSSLSRLMIKNFLKAYFLPKNVTYI